MFMSLSGVQKAPRTTRFNSNVAILNPGIDEFGVVVLVEGVFEPVPVRVAFEDGENLPVLGLIQPGLPVTVVRVHPHVWGVQALEKLFQRLRRPAGEPLHVVEHREPPQMGTGVGTEVKAGGFHYGANPCVVHIYVQRDVREERHST